MAFPSRLSGNTFGAYASSQAWNSCMIGWDLC